MATKRMPLAQQVIVVTGASSGIGLATVRLAAKHGCKVVLGARDEAALAEICGEINAAGGDACFVVCDVGSSEDVERLARTALDRHGRIDTWANVAGVGIIASLAHTAETDHRRLFDTNYFGVVNGSMAAAAAFRKVGNAGAIVNVGSSFSDFAVPTMGAYAASKFAVKAFSNALRVELRQEKLPVQVTLVKPSVIDSMFYDHAQTSLDTAARIPPPRYAPSVVAEVILDAAAHTRREIAVGMPAVMGATFGVLVPALMERINIVLQEGVWRDVSAPKLESGVRTTPQEGRERSGRAHARSFSVTATLQRHPLLVLGAFGVGALLGARAISRRR